MKKLSFTVFFTICCFVLSLTKSQAQVLRRANTSSSISAVVPVNGTIEGSVFIMKSEIPNTTNINQIALAIKQSLKAFEFSPQNNGLLSDQYIHVAKGQLKNATTVVNVKSNGDTFVIEYAIQKLPLMKPMTVKLVGNAAQNLRFAVDPLLKNFPVAYLTTCDRTFECYNFRGVFIPVIK